MMKIILSISVICLLLFYGCTNIVVKDNDIVGIWKADDGATLKIYKDGTCDVSDFNYNNVYSDDETIGKKYSFSGTWKLVNDNGSNFKLHIHSPKIIYDVFYVNFDFDIGSEKMKNKEQLYLYVNIGDPDNLEFYKFKKL